MKKPLPWMATLVASRVFSMAPWLKIGEMAPVVTPRPTCIGFELEPPTVWLTRSMKLTVLDLKPMAEWGAIAKKDLELLHYADTPVDAFQHLRDHLIAHHLEPTTDQEAAAPGIAKTRG